MNGSLYAWSNLNVYFASYLKNKGNDVTPEDTAFLMPCIFLVQYCFMTLGVKLGNKIGPRLVVLIGISFMLSSYGIMIKLKLLFGAFINGNFRNGRWNSKFICDQKLLDVFS